MKTEFNSQSNGEWRLTIVSESGAEGAELRRMFDMQPKGLHCHLDQLKSEEGVGETRLVIFSPRVR
jgi:hypothetical protein